MSETVSIIVPAYNEAPNLGALHERLSVVAASVPGYEFEFLFVDDGSKDATPDVLSELHRRDPRVKAVRFSRNFGSHAACLAGLMEARGDFITFLAADLQDPPELVPEMLAKISQGFDVVMAVRSEREDSWLTVQFANAYHRLMRRYAITDWPAQGADVFMITRPVCETVTRWHQKNTSVFAQLLWVGFRQTSISYAKQQRRSGSSKWTWSRKIKLLIDSFVSFSFAPLRLISYAGITFSMFGLAYALFIVLKKLFYGVPVQGWASLMVALLVISGFQLLMLGVIGEYLWRVADAVRGAPAFVIQSRLGMSGTDADAEQRWTTNAARPKGPKEAKERNGKEPEEVTLERKWR